MKKLMVFALALASVGAAYAGCSPTPVTTNAAVVYNVKFNGKTTVGKSSAIKGTSGSACTPGSSGTNACVRIPNAAISIEGFLVSCGVTCDTSLTTDGATGTFWMTKPYKVGVDSAELKTLNLNVIGASKKDAEVYGTFKGTLTDIEGQTIGATDDQGAWQFAGFGKFGTVTVDSANKVKANIYTSLCGNFVGEMTKSYYVNKGSCCATIVWACSDLATAIEDKDTVAFGTWSIKYNSSASKKYAKDGTTPKTPSWL